VLLLFFSFMFCCRKILHKIWLLINTLNYIKIFAIPLRWKDRVPPSHHACTGSSQGNRKWKQCPGKKNLTITFVIKCKKLPGQQKNWVMMMRPECFREAIKMHRVLIIWSHSNYFPWKWSRYAFYSKAWIQQRL